jgi:hypothetical protein
MRLEQEPTLMSRIEPDESELAQMIVQIRNACPTLLPDERVLPRSRLYDLAPYEIGTHRS